MLKIDSGTQNDPRKCFPEKFFKSRFLRFVGRPLGQESDFQRSAPKTQKSTFEKIFWKTLPRVILGPWIDFEHQIWLWVTLWGSQAIFDSSQNLHPNALLSAKSENGQFQWAPHHHQSVSFGSNFISAVQRDRFSSHIIFVQNWNFGGDVELTEIGQIVKMALSKANECKFWDDSKMAFRAS